VGEASGEAQVLCRVSRPAVALETTLLAHGVPVAEAPALSRSLSDVCRAEGASPCLIGVVGGQPIAGLNDAELHHLLGAAPPKANSANLGLLLNRGVDAATSVSTTMEIAAAASIPIFATGGLGGVHRGYGRSLDISADLAAFTRFPVAVVCSGVKSILDVESTREALETLGVPVVGSRTDCFPAFYHRQSDAGVDARFDDVQELGRFLRFELARTGRGVVVCNPIPAEHEIDRAAFAAWLEEAERTTTGTRGRGVTPALLGALHAVSDGATLRANLALVEDNTRLAAQLAVAMEQQE
jgi:pseudouridine-5'-phosphate glycosidase